MAAARQEDLEATRSEVWALQELLCSEVAAIRERLNALEGGAAPPPSKVQPTAAALEEGQGGEELSLAVLIRDAEEERAGYQLQAKAWDAALFVGTGAMGPIGSAFATLTLAMNVFGQVLFLRILQTSRSFLAGSPPPSASLALWRVNSGHSFATEQGGASLVSHVCQLDESVSVATTQKDLVSDAKEYLNTSVIEGTELGPLLCMFCLILWLLTVIVHLREIFSFTVSLVLLRSRETHFKREGDGAISVASISNLRCAVLLCLTALRAVIIALLLSLGSLWLARTGAVDELLLNAVSLAFVLDLDELLFGALAPDTAQVLVARAKPLTGLRPRHWHGIGPRPVGYLVACCLLLVAMSVTEIEETKATMAGINETICGGLQEVIIDIEPSTKRVTAAAAKPWEPAPVKEFSPVDKLVHDIIWERQSWDKGELRKARAYANIPINDIAALQHCFDQDEEVAKRQAIFVHLTGNGTSDYKSCRDLEKHCGDPYMDQLRMYCPLTCGCDIPHIGVDRHGCPQSCRNTKRYRSELLSMPCNDTVNFTAAPYWGNMSTWGGVGEYSCFFANIFPWLCAPPSMALLPSLRYYCPKTCGCEGGGEECPPSCAAL